MKNYWWKILGALLILYTIVGGMTVPIKSGIVKVTPNSIQSGSEVEIQIDGYNSNYDQSDDLAVWLKAGNTTAIKATKVSAINATSLKANFTLPNELPSEGSFHTLSVVVNSKIDGISLLPDHVALQAGAMDTLNRTQWSEINNLVRKEGFNFPYRNILVESIRNTFYHIPLWFAMVMIFFVAVVYSILQLYKPQVKYDAYAVAFTEIGVLLGILGTVTGAIWAKNTWGQYWSWDIKQNVSIIAMLVYLAYFVLRGSFDDHEKGGRISAVYNIFAFAALIPLLFVIPRMASSLHPGNGGNPGMGGEDLDNTMKYFLYPAFFGWFLVGMWMASLRARFIILRDKYLLKMND